MIQLHISKMNRTKIEWSRSPDGSQGYTLNSKTGCLNHTPEGLCLGGLFPCYAYRLAHGRLETRYLGNLKAQLLEGGDSNDPFYPRFWSERLEEPYRIKKPIGFFLDDMSDWMGDYWPKEWTEAELQMMRDNPQHRIYTLTKQPQNLIKWSPFPENCWVGVTATNANATIEALSCLRRIEAKIKFISFEPLLTQCLVDDPWLCIDWVIIGAQTNPYKPPKLEGVLEIVNAADGAGVKVFLKNNLVPMIAGSLNPDKLKLYPDNMHLRQEMPE